MSIGLNGKQNQRVPVPSNTVLRSALRRIHAPWAWSWRNSGAACGAVCRFPDDIQPDAGLQVGRPQGRAPLAHLLLRLVKSFHLLLPLVHHALLEPAQLLRLAGRGRLVLLNVAAADS